jgi:hypothetical protein
MEYLTSRHLFDTELLVVTILRTALCLATIDTNFMGQACNGEYKLIHINKEDKMLYRNMLLFIFTRRLLECACHSMAKKSRKYFFDICSYLHNYYITLIDITISIYNLTITYYS